MEIDADIPMGKSKPTTLGSATKGPMNKKPIFTAIGIIGLVIIIALAITFILPLIDFTPVVVDDNNQDITPIEPINFSCPKRLNLNIPGKTAVFTDNNTTKTLISTDGERSGYIQISQGLKIIDVIKNTYADSNNIEDDIINLLKENNVNAVAILGAGQKMIKQFEANGIKCYSVGGSVSSLIGEEEIVIETYCNRFTDQNLIGKIAIGADNNTLSLVSADNERSPFFFIYDGNNLLEVIENSAKDSNNINVDLLALIQYNNINNLLLPSFSEEFENELEDNNITCYKAGGEITGLMNK